MGLSDSIYNTYPSVFNRLEEQVGIGEGWKWLWRYDKSGVGGISNNLAWYVIGYRAIGIYIATSMSISNREGKVSSLIFRFHG